MEYYLAIESNVFESVLMKWMNLEQSEVNKKDKYHIKHMYMVARKIILMILLLQDSKGDTNIENRLMVTVGKEEGGMT